MTPGAEVPVLGRGYIGYIMKMPLLIEILLLSYANMSPYEKSFTVKAYVPLVSEIMIKNN